MGYIFDTNIFIRSKNELPEDVWPTFWKKMAELIRDGKISSSIKVKEEINKGKDELTEWIKKNTSSNFYINIDDSILGKYKEAQDWANNNTNYKESAKNEFANVADAYLVATAAAKELTLVTYEIPAPTSKSRIKIPDACNALDVRYCDLNTAFRELGISI